MSRKTRRSRLLAIGGGERRARDGVILRCFVEMAGGKGANVVVCAVAVGDPEEPLREYARVLRSIGAAGVHVEPFRTRASGEERSLLDALEEASALFLTGGRAVPER